MTPILFGLFIGQSISAPPVALNHFFVTLDKKTYAALRESKWLKEEFGDVVEQSTKSGDETWSGLYVYGLGTYIEIFAESKTEVLGNSGIGFLTTMPGGVDNAFARLKQAFGPRAERELRYLNEGPEPKPWFHNASYTSAKGSKFGAWLMEYFSTANHGTSLPSEAATFAKYRKKVKQPYHGLMGDIQRLSVKLPDADKSDFEKLLVAFGFESASPGNWKVPSGTVQVAGLSSKQPYSTVSEMACSLTRKPAKDYVKTFGTGCVVTVRKDGTATWSFR